jgi:endonuclease III
MAVAGKQERMRAKAKPRRAPAGAKARAQEVVERLAREYPNAECALVHRNPFELLVATILSAQTTDVRVNLTTPALFARYPSAADMAGASQEELEAIIKPTGFFRTKARALREMSQDVLQRHAGEVPAAMDELVALRGVGRKTANVVLGVGFGIPGFPVDTHVARLTRRLRLTSSTDPVRIEADICRLVPPSEWTELSLRFILHGRRVCLAQRPRCPQCVLVEICPSSYLGLRPAAKKTSPRRRVRQ